MRFDPVSGLCEGDRDLCAERRLVGLDREQPVGALSGDGAGDVGVGGDGVHRDQRALQPVPGAEPLEERRERREIACLTGATSCASTRRAVVAKAETRWSGAAPALR